MLRKQKKKSFAKYFVLRNRIEEVIGTKFIEQVSTKKVQDMF